MVVQIGDPQHLLPSNTNESEGAAVLQAVYSTLITYDPETNEPVNLIAESIESEDQTTWTITLKEGWTFHNGEPVNAESFVRSWNYAAYGPNAQLNAHFFDRIQGYEEVAPPDPDGEEGPQQAPEPTAETLSGLRVIDELTFEVTLSAPFASFPIMLGYTAFAPMAEECLADVEACERHPIGNGPFMFAEDSEWIPETQARLELVRFEDYGGEPAKLDRLIFQVYDDIVTAYEDFEAGLVDVVRNVDPSLIEQARQDYPDTFINVPIATMGYLAFPTYDPRYADPRLRHAISMAINRQEIIDAIWNGTYEPATSVASSLVAGHREDACGELCEYNPDEARRLLDEIGGFEGTMELWYNAGAGHDQWMEALGNQIREELGIEFELHGELQFAQFLDRREALEMTGPFRSGWIMDYPSLENFLRPLFGTGASTNDTGYSNPEVDALIDMGDQAATLEESIQYYQQAEDIILQDMPMIPLWNYAEALVYSPEFENVIYNPVEQNLDWAQITVA